MKRVVGVVVWLVALLGVMSWPAVSYNWSTGATTYEETTIRSYDASFTIDDDGDLHAVETLVVDFPGFGKHGIFRFFDEADPSATHARRVPHDITVTMDGQDEPFTLLDERNGRITNVRIGDADVFVDQGEHTYVIDYRIDGVLEKGTEIQDATPRTQLYWNLIPSGWRQTIDTAHLTVTLPVPATGVQCARGTGATSGCTVEGDGTKRLTVDAETLSPNTPDHRQGRSRHADTGARYVGAVAGAPGPGARAQPAEPRDRRGARPARRARSARGRRARSRRRPRRTRSCTHRRTASGRPRGRTS